MKEKNITALGAAALTVLGGIGAALLNTAPENSNTTINEQI